MSVVLLSLFSINIALTLFDAATAYKKAPLYLTALNDDPDGQARAVKNIHQLLPFLVALYTALNCYAYSFRDLRYVGGMTLVLLCDIAVQFYVCRRITNSQSSVDEG